MCERMKNINVREDLVEDVFIRDLPVLPFCGCVVSLFGSVRLFRFTSESSALHLVNTSTQRCWTSRLILQLELYEIHLIDG